LKGEILDQFRNKTKNRDGEHMTHCHLLSIAEDGTIDAETKGPLEKDIHQG
jgi:hypothetical protein